MDAMLSKSVREVIDREFATDNSGGHEPDTDHDVTFQMLREKRTALSTYVNLFYKVAHCQGDREQFLQSGAHRSAYAPRTFILLL
jgi:hypothetical protein